MVLLILVCCFVLFELFACSLVCLGMGSLTVRFILIGAVFCFVVCVDL